MPETCELLLGLFPEFLGDDSQPGRSIVTTSSLGTGICFFRPLESRTVVDLPQHHRPMYLALQSMRRIVGAYHARDFARRPVGTFLRVSSLAMELIDRPATICWNIQITHFACRWYAKSHGRLWAPATVLSCIVRINRERLEAERKIAGRLAIQDTPTLATPHAIAGLVAAGAVMEFHHTHLELPAGDRGVNLLAGGNEFSARVHQSVTRANALPSLVKRLWSSTARINGSLLRIRVQILSNPTRSVLVPVSAASSITSASLASIPSRASPARISRLLIFAAFWVL